MESRVHSVKVPRLYKVASHILRSHKNGGGSVKNLVYESRKKHPNLKALYALVMECVRHECELSAALAATPRLLDGWNDERLARILVTELLWGKGSLAGRSRPVQTVLQHADDIRAAVAAAKPPTTAHGDKCKRLPPPPRFVRVNTLKNRLQRVLKQLKRDGYLEVIYDRSTTSYDDFLSLVRALSEHEFLSDFHVPNLLVFCGGTHFYAHPLHLDGSLLLQDKASCLPVLALDAPVGATVLDACAAPGMKTAQIAAAVSGGWNAVLAGAPQGKMPAAAPGKVYAVERDFKRCETLKKIMKTSGADEIAQVVLADFLQLEAHDYPDVEYIVLDPSCSGSGMIGREGSGTSMSARRLRSLSSLQARMLIHAMTFPNVRRIAYSTCSISEEENEKVVKCALDSNQGAGRFHPLKCLDNWQRRGMTSFHCAQAYIRSDPDQDLTNGFFVAVLQRTNQEQGKEKKDENAFPRKKKKKQKISKNVSEENCSLKDQNSEPANCKEPLRTKNPTEVAKTMKKKKKLS